MPCGIAKRLKRKQHAHTQQNKTIFHRILLKGPFKNMLGQGSTTFLAPGAGLWTTISPQAGMGTGGVRGGAMEKAETVLG